ncbi:MAG: tetratricopeptide repeat protein, partial [Acidobacteria bacterium]|nr:tetratricopeptide repeat protein [Acidobacteriota bacterium]
MNRRALAGAAFLCLASCAGGCGTGLPTSEDRAAAYHHNNLGVALMDHGSQKEAIEEFSAALARWDGYVTARVNLGIALHYSGDHLGAARAFEAALRADPGDPRAHYVLGLLHYYQTARYDKATTQFELVARLDPHDTWTQFYLGLSLSRSGRAAETIEPLQRAADLSPGHQAALYQLSLALRSLGRTDQATVA